MTDDRRGYMPKVPDTVKRTEFLELPSLAHKFEGTPTRYTPPICRDQTPHFPEANPPKPCTHANGYHARHGMETGGGAWGLRYSKRTGAFSWPQSSTMRFKPGVLDPKLLENMAACTALGLSYWCEAGPHEVWAVDDRQRTHRVDIDRKAGKARHACGTWDLDTDPPESRGKRHTLRYDPTTQLPREGSRELCGDDIPVREAYDIAALQDELFNNEEDEMATRDLAKTPVSMGGLTAAERRIQKAAREQRIAAREADWARQDAEIEAAVAAARTEPAKPVKIKPPTGMTMAAAIALLHHDPDHLGDLPTEHLNTLLGTTAEKAYHPKIRKELKSR